MSDPFVIEVRFHGGFTSSQRVGFSLAADRWGGILESRGPGPFREEDTRAHLVIDARALDFEGDDDAQGHTGPTVLLRETRLPARGIMEFDQADLERLDAENELENTVIHEMGHVLGFGSLWELHGLIREPNTLNPVYRGASAVEEYARLLGDSGGPRIPLENRGGPGTRDGHWRDSVFHGELMAGFVSSGENPLSRLTAASMADLGYQVNLDAADLFELPDSEGEEAPEEPWYCCHRFPIWRFQSREEIAGELHGEEPCETRYLSDGS